MKPCDSERRPLPLQRENEMFPGDTVLSGAPDPGAARALQLIEEAMKDGPSALADLPFLRS
jgi:hypothetical protein